MTKRAYPFEPCISRQMKMHVNNFELDKASLIEVQNRTFEKLFLAQRNICNAISSNLSISKRNGSNSSENNRFWIQKQVTNYFSGNSSKEPQKVLQCDSGSLLSTCSYCSSTTENVNKCKVCNEYFCQSCSFADYNIENESVGLCFTCS